MAEGRKIQLSVTGVQYPPGQELAGMTQEEREYSKVVTRIQVEAEYYRRGDTHYLFYEEQMEGCRTSLRTRVKFRKGYLEVTRRGTMESRMTFEPGKNNRTEYLTPYGKLLLDVLTDSVTVEENEEERCPRATAEYVLENGGQQIGTYHLELEET